MTLNKHSSGPGCSEKRNWPENVSAPATTRSTDVVAFVTDTNSTGPSTVRTSASAALMANRRK
jgi:hypothetical protein